MIPAKKVSHNMLFPKMLLLLFVMGRSVMAFGQVIFEDNFNSYSDGVTSGTNWTAENGASVQSGKIAYTHTGETTLTDTLWYTSVLDSTCGDFEVQYYFSGNDNNRASLIYSNDSGTTWNSVGTSPSELISGAQIELRLVVANMTSNETVQLDSVVIYEPLEVGVESNNETCQGNNNASITVNATCGYDQNYTYTWTCPNEYGETPGTDVSSISGEGVIPGNYSIVVENNFGESKQVDVTITKTDTLILGITVQNWSCEKSTTVGCNGSITANISGGTAPYIVEIGDGTTALISKEVTETSFTVDTLCAGSYTIDVTDANNCVVPQQDTTITIDNAAPTCTSPANYFMTLEDYNNLDSASTLITSTYSENKFVSTDADTLIYEFNATGYNKLYLDFEVEQTTQNDATWGDNDYVQFWVDYDGNETLNGDQIYSSTGTYTSPETDSLRLSDVADDNSNLYVYIVYYTTSSDKSYNISDITLSGNSMTASIPTSLSGTPSDCSDNFSSATVTYTDGTINWICNETGNQEFWFERTFAVADACGNSNTDTQQIGVGEFPEVTQPGDTIFDFCHNEDVSIAIPAYSDNSETCDDGGVSVYYEVSAQGESTIIASGDPESTASAITVTFPQPVANDTVYTIWWIATDEAGLKDTVKQTVTVLKPISVTFTPEKFDFCSGEEVSFTITPGGGTGSYISLFPGETLDETGYSVTITPDGTWMDGSGTFTTSNLTIAAPDIQLIYTDVTVDGAGGVVGGCYSSIITFDGNGGNYTVHQNIATQAITRDGD